MTIPPGQRRTSEDEPLTRFLASSLTPRRRVPEPRPAPPVLLPIPSRKRVAAVHLAEPEPPRRRVGPLAWGVSLTLHLVSVGVAGWLVARASRTEASPPPVMTATMEMTAELPLLDLPTMTEVTALVDARTLHEPEHAPLPHASGPDGAARPDTSRAGRGGTFDVSAPALNLADRDDAISLTKDEQSRLDRSQLQRLAVATKRASEDDRRATWEPMELTFLASGKGARKERRELADTDPSQGARAAKDPGTLGGSPGASTIVPGEGESPRDPGTSIVGGVIVSPGVGVLHGATSTDHRASADVAFARPQVTESRPAVPSNATGKPKDNAESDQEVSAQVRSLLHASTAGGQTAGAGVGGEKAKEPTPGSGGDSGPGSRTKALGQGGGQIVDPDGEDARLSMYRRGVTSRIARHLHEFPRQAALEGRSGQTIVRFTIARDGSVSGISTVRASSVDEFDEDARQAVAKAAPFAAIPANLKAPITVFFTVDSPNAAVR